jgi:hypothetical protein
MDSDDDGIWIQPKKQTTDSTYQKYFMQNPFKPVYMDPSASLTVPSEIPHKCSRCDGSFKMNFCHDSNKIVYHVGGLSQTPLEKKTKVCDHRICDRCDFYKRSSCIICGASGLMIQDLNIMRQIVSTDPDVIAEMGPMQKFE